MKRLTFKLWVQVLLLILFIISFIMVMFIDINALISILGMLGCAVSLMLLDKYGTMDEWFD